MTSGFNGAAGVHRRKFSMRILVRPALYLASMGPPAFTGGNATTGRAPARPNGLQWGRRRSPAEILWWSGSLGSSAGRFNGAAGVHRRKLGSTNTAPPRLAGFNGAAGVHRRKYQDRRQARHRLDASMGPPAFTGGNSAATERAEKLARASMGPPAFTGGNSGRRAQRAGHRPVLQWGRRRSPAEISRCVRGSNCGAGFNGAAGVHRRKYGAPGPERRALFRASMGPPAFTGGNECVKCGSRLQEHASMGPPAFTGGNDPQRPVRPLRLLASMGPPAFTGGNIVGAQATATSARLQWGRRRSPAEIYERGVSRDGHGCFNGAAGVHRRKSANWPPWRLATALQWGRRRSPAEISYRRMEGTVLGFASMGPPAFTGGNVDALDVAAHDRPVLQWGRRRSPAEIVIKKPLQFPKVERLVASGPLTRATKVA